MTTSEDIAAQILTATEAELFQAKPNLDGRELALLDAEFLGTALTGPARVDVDSRRELPLFVAFRTTGLRAWEVSRESNAVLCAANVDTREVFFGQLFADPKLDEHPPGPDAVRPPMPTGPSATSVGALVRRIDARMILDLPWRPGRYRLAVLYFDQRSNVIDVELTGASAPHAGQVRGVSPRLPDPPADDSQQRASLPTYLPFTNAPALSGTPALFTAFAPDPGRGAPLALWAVLAASAAPIHVPGELASVTEIDARMQTVSAVLPLTLAIVRLDGRVPARLEVGAPVYGAALASEGQPLTAHLSIDVLATLRRPLAAGSYRAYAFFEGELFGPEAFELT